MKNKVYCVMEEQDEGVGHLTEIFYSKTGAVNFIDSSKMGYFGELYIIEKSIQYCDNLTRGELEELYQDALLLIKYQSDKMNEQEEGISKVIAEVKSWSGYNDVTWIKGMLEDILNG